MTTKHAVNLPEAIGQRLLVVPDYQRPYAWEAPQLADLWEDLDLLGGGGQRHYAGTLVLRDTQSAPLMSAAGAALTTCEVVDGQQRLTTCFLLLDRIRRGLETLGQQGVEDAAEAADGVRRTYGLVKVGGALRPRLSLGSDLNQYWVETILGGQQPTTKQLLAGQERLKKAAAFFDSKIDALMDDDSDVAFARLLDLLGRVTNGLRFLVYDVETAAEVGVIFETLNGRGRDLSELEKIKNYLLFLVRTVPGDAGHDLAAFINDAWSGVFADLAGTDVDEDQLLRAHWLATQNPDVRTWKGATSVKSVFQRSTFVPDSIRLVADPAVPQGLDDERTAELTTKVKDYVRTLRLCALFLNEMQSAHAKFGNFTSHDSEARSRSAALRRSNVVAIFRPLLFASRLAHPTDGEFYATVTSLCETYSARVFTIAQRRANAGQTQLYKLAHALVNGASTKETLDELSAVAWRYADDDRVRSSLHAHEDWYNRRGHKYFLYEYELTHAKNENDVMDFREFVGTRRGKTTEHILPQNPNWDSDDWAPHFSEAEHQRLRHTLGNLVLTYDNSAYGNKCFAAKKGSQGQGKPPCYADSKLTQERELAAYPHWTPTTIAERQRKLADWALGRWHLDAPATAVALAVDDLVDEADDDEEPTAAAVSSPAENEGLA